jgi:putative transposase
VSTPLLAATDGRAAVLVSGRDAKAIVRYRNKAGAALSSRIDRKTRGSKRRKTLVRAKHRMLDQSARKLKDTLHKATRAVADAFAGHRVIVGRPFNDAARMVGKKQAQQVSSASNARLFAMLDYKLAGAVEVPEPYSSQTCPGCGCRQKCRRVYRCATCGWSAPRDAVGAVNIRSLGLYGAMRPEQPVPPRIVFVRPLRKYPATPQGVAGSPGGTPAREASCVAPV